MNYAAAVLKITSDTLSSGVRAQVLDSAGTAAEYRVMSESPQSSAVTQNSHKPVKAKVRITNLHGSLTSELPYGERSLSRQFKVPLGTDISQVEPIIPSLIFGQASVYVSLTIPSSGFAQIMMIVTASGNKTQLINQSYLFSQGQIRTLVLVNVSPGGGALSFFPLELNDLN